MTIFLKNFGGGHVPLSPLATAMSASALNDKTPGKKIKVLKATFPEELPLCCAVLISAAIYTRLHRVCLFKIKRNDSLLFHVLKQQTSILSGRPEHGSFIRASPPVLTQKGWWCLLTNKTIYKCFWVKQIYCNIAMANSFILVFGNIPNIFCSIFQGVSFYYHQRNVTSRSRTSRSRSRLLWQSLGLEVWARSRR